MTIREMKEKSRNILGNEIFGDKWLYCLLGFLIVDLIMGFTAPLILITYGFFQIGLTRSLIGLVKKEDEKFNFEKLVFGLKDENLVGHLILGLLNLLFVTLWSLLLIIPGVIKSYAYSLAYIIKNDHNDMEAIDILDESQKLMRGHKFDLFLLDLSFLGWYILGFLCLGVGILWVYPYHYLTRTQFLLEIYENKNEKLEF